MGLSRIAGRDQSAARCVAHVGGAAARGCSRRARARGSGSVVERAGAGSGRWSCADVGLARAVVSAGRGTGPVVGRAGPAARCGVRS